MSVKIGIISDVHATAAPLREALTIFRQHRVALILCAGDIAGYGSELEESVALLLESECQTILGNHDLWFLDNPGGQAGQGLITFFGKLPLIREISCAGKRLYLVHASPRQPLAPGIRLLDEEGRIVEARRQQWRGYLEKFPAEVLVVGHTHQVFAEKLGHPLVINPGSTKFNHTCVLLSLPDMELEILPLSGREPLIAWNWGMMQDND